MPARPEVHNGECGCNVLLTADEVRRLVNGTPAESAVVANRLAPLARESVAKPTFYVGAGTCGLGAGAAATLKALQAQLATRGIDGQVLVVGCIGLCSAEPMVDVQLAGRTRVSFQKITADRVPTLLDSVLSGKMPRDWMLGQFRPAERPLRRGGRSGLGIADGSGQGAGPGPRSECATGVDIWPDIPYLDEHPFFAPQTRWVLANCGLIDPTSVDEYLVHGGYHALAETLRSITPDELCDQVEKSGLRGRGGGGFPTGRKWKFARQTAADQKYLICNADEGDPGAFMDRAVIEGDPHRLVEGMAIAAYAIGASKAYVYIRAEYPLAITNLEIALTHARHYGLLGKNILESGFTFDIAVKKGAGAFVCGEETALINSVEGRRGMPRPRPPFPAVSGAFGKPTVINNVETLSNLPTLVGRGWERFAALGTAKSKGTKVFALSGKVQRTGLIEVAMGTTMRQIIFDVGGGPPPGKAYKAAQIGGPSGGCIPDQHLDIQIDYESLKTVGAMMGSGGLVVMDEDNCMVDVAKFFMDFIQRESCGKCIPCREGTKQMLEILKSITRARRSETREQTLERFRGVMHLQRLAQVIQDTSLCGLGQSAPNPVLSTLRFFRDEYEAHVYDRKCPAGVCHELLTYHIDPNACKGCTICGRKCPTGAIIGAPKTPHYIVPDKCIACGACMEACRLNAVIAE